MLSIDEKEYLLIEKYRPKNLDDIVITESLRTQAKKWVKDGEIPNLLLSSKIPGTGKTSFAHTLIHETDAEALFINASLYPNIDILRNKVQGFAMTASFDGRAKIVVLDEADSLNSTSTQKALRGFIEEYSKNCRFILTCNYKDKIIEPIQNRLIEIDFDLMFNANKKELIKQMYLRTKSILEHEKIQFNQDDLLYLVGHFYPSSRTVINKVQEFNTNGTLLINKVDIDTTKINKDLIDAIKAKDFNKIRLKISKMSDPGGIFTTIYENIEEFNQDKRPSIVITCAKYSAWNSQVRDRLVNAVACAVEIGELC